jgi:hypothetical protein
MELYLLLTHYHRIIIDSMNLYVNVQFIQMVEMATMMMHSQYYLYM